MVQRFVTRNYFKLHACSRWNHAPIEATARLLAAERLNLAARVVLGDNGGDVYTEAAVAHPVIRDVASHVEVVEEPTRTAQLPAVRAARVRIGLRNGREVEVTEDRAPGGYDAPDARELLEEKFDGLVSPSHAAAATRRLARWVRELSGRTDDVRDLRALLAAG